MLILMAVRLAYVFAVGFRGPKHYLFVRDNYLFG